MSTGPSAARSTLGGFSGSFDSGAVRARTERDPCARSVSEHARSAVGWSRGGAPKCGDTMSVNVTDDQGATSAKSFPGRPIFWRDAPTTKAGYPEGFYDAGGFYDGAVRIWGDGPDSPAVTVRLLGNEHAVSDGSGP